MVFRHLRAGRQFVARPVVASLAAGLAAAAAGAHGDLGASLPLWCRRVVPTHAAHPHGIMAPPHADRVALFAPTAGTSGRPRALRADVLAAPRAVRLLVAATLDRGHLDEGSPHRRRAAASHRSGPAQTRLHAGPRRRL